MKTIKRDIFLRGEHVIAEGVRVRDTNLLFSGTLLRTVRLEDEWRDDIDDPEAVVSELRASSLRTDMLTFWQRIPETEPKFSYFFKWNCVAAIPITTFEDWWSHQINAKTRNMVRKSKKRDVRIQRVPFSDRFVKGVVDIFNETPVRRGKRFWHYGQGFDSAKLELSDRLDDSIFVAAYFGDELIGFIKMLRTDRFAMITMILDKFTHRDKAPMNGLIAECVKFCADAKIPYLTYTVWRRGSHGDFQKRNGFQPYPVPRYYVPVSPLGALALKAGAHDGLKGLLPDTVMKLFLALRSRWYGRGN